MTRSPSRRPSPAVRGTLVSALALLPLTLGGCGGSGGGGGGTASSPRLVSVTFLGSGVDPAPGDRLLLVFDRDIEIVPDTVLDDDDLDLATGSLGTPASAPTRLRAFTVELTLGAGTNFAPGTTTLRVAETMDAVREVGGGRVAADDGVDQLVRISDGDFPTIDRVTVEGIPDALNGKGSAGGLLQIARRGAAFDVEYSDASQPGPAGGVLLTIDGSTSTGSGVIGPGIDLESELVTTMDAGHASLRVPAGASLPLGDHVVTVIVLDASGMPSTPATFSFRVVDPSNELRPLESGQLWYLSFDRDLESFTVTSGTFGRSVTIDPGANGVPDLLDILATVGLQIANPIADIGDGRDSNTAVVDLFETAMLADLGVLFPGITVEFTFDRPGSFPDDNFVPYDQFAFSQICIAGAPAETPSGTLGAALVDLRNRFQDDDCAEDFNGMRLGVFAHTIVNIGYETAHAGFRLAFRPFASALGGTPIGAATGDDARLLGTQSDTRADQIAAAIDWLATALAVITAHECGHSMGLVANGAMPHGLYGDDPVNFPLSPGQPDTNADVHIENQLLFPGTPINVMSPSIDLDAAQDAGTRFNFLNLAYLRERALYDER